MLQDFVSAPPLRSIVTSEDNKAWVLPVGVAGELGTPRSYAAFNQIGDDRQTRRRRNALDGATSPAPRPPSPTSRSRATGIGFRSSWPSAFWCSSSCWWFTAARSPCCCR